MNLSGNDSIPMPPNLFRDVLVLTGPTASGKSALALEVAEHLGAEIVSMDSMALYRGMDIGTAKPTIAERCRVRHHLVDVLDPWQSGSVAWWLEQAETCVREIVSRGRRALVVGGTPLYLKALLYGLFAGPPQDADLRRRLENEAADQGAAVLHQRLALIDPPTASRLHPNDLRRIVRALEVWELTGRPMSVWQTQWEKDAPVRVAAPVLWLDLPRAELYARIDARVLGMIEGGLVDEAETLRRLQSPLSREAAQALGYQEAFDFLDGRLSRDEMIARVQLRSRQFAKRQLTWFRQLRACHPVSRQLTFAHWGLTMDPGKGTGENSEAESEIATAL